MTFASIDLPVAPQTRGSLRARASQVVDTWRWAFGVARTYRIGGPAAIDAAMIDRIGR